MKHPPQIHCGCGLSYLLTRDNHKKWQSLRLELAERFKIDVRVVMSDCRCGSTQTTILTSHRRLTTGQIKNILNSKK
jgi:hypothetical protein